MVYYLLDIIGGIIILIGIIRGYSNGFVIELTQIASVFIGIIVALKYTNTIATLAHQQVAFSFELIQIVAFFIVFALVVMIMHFIGNLITRLLKLIFLGWFNRLLGVIFGVIKAMLLLCLLAVIAQRGNDVIQIIPQAYFDHSILYQFSLGLGESILDFFSYDSIEKNTPNQTT
ncbi:MAG: CvpA family protein [Flavobacteriaceae bacterium]|nr:CvpA family protein [Flavobacteriaceae bacterium]MCY4215405.1 CvpA family protein [Flavobacteriaceae bacterium]MCY4253108.1 CvpA family protein [Flavobacteriaceae bacterium]